MAVEVIMTLEQQVRGKLSFFSICHYANSLFSTLHIERNLNPKAACLKRREEEKSEDGPKLPHHNMLPNYPSMPVSNITFDF